MRFFTWLDYWERRLFRCSGRSAFWRALGAIFGLALLTQPWPEVRDRLALAVGETLLAGLGLAALILIGRCLFVDPSEERPGSAHAGEVPPRTRP